jgi:predicted metal-binding membrane protein
VVIAIVAIALVVSIVAAWVLLAWRLRQGDQPVSTSWGREFRRRDKD